MDATYFENTSHSRNVENLTPRQLSTRSTDFLAHAVGTDHRCTDGRFLGLGHQV